MAIESVNEAGAGRPRTNQVNGGLGPVLVGQIGVILNAIAELAASVECLTINRISDEENQVRASELVAIKCLAKQIGWLADLGGEKSGAGQCFGNAEDWMMPPAYFNFAKKAVAHV